MQISVFLCAGLVGLILGAPGGVPQNAVPQEGSGPGVDPLVQLAHEFLATQSRRLEKNVAREVRRNNIATADLPDPRVIPQGSVKLSLSAQRLSVKDVLTARVGWSLHVAPSSDRQFVFHLHLVHFLGPKYRGGAGNGGLAMSQFNGERHPISTRMPPRIAGKHRAMAILSVRSLKTGQIYILDVAEQGYSAVEAAE